MSSDLDLAIKAAKKAGNHIRKQFGKEQYIFKKGENDYVTKTDKEAEEIILYTLNKTGYSVLGEETGENIKQSPKKWIIDPIDGTINYIKGVPFFAISIALMNSNELMLGVVYDPIAKECYWAEKNTGSFLNGKRINVSKKKSFEGVVALMTHGRSPQCQQEYLKATSKLMLECRMPVFNQGSTALMLALIARGSYDAFLCCGDALYDYAGGLIIAKEAGAKISDWHGKEWDNSNNYVLVANNELSEIISAGIADIQ
ncbi:inositol monophosphatase [Patescibacteria group bacterium]|nr:inositol monophosphatase [Patescibacteria group bacterium]